MDKIPENTEPSIEPLTQEELDLVQAKIDAIKKHYETPTEAQIDIEKQDTHVIGKTFKEQVAQKGKIKLDKETRQAIYNHHHAEYAPGGKNYETGLVAGLERMQPWFHGMREQFKKHNVPEKFIYLSIAESNFNMDAVSHKAAIGPFQITKDTAKLKAFNMSVSKYYDERRDPIKSAELCAKHLRASFDTFLKVHHNSEEEAWKLALMDYNGGFINAYNEYLLQKDKNAPIEVKEVDTISPENTTFSSLAQKHETLITLIQRANLDKDSRKLRIGDEIKIPQKRSFITFEGFNKWLEERINTEIAQVLSSDSIEVQSGDTLSEIAEKYKTTTAELQALNNLSSSEIKLGQKLKVPLTKEQKVDLAIGKISSYSENINYPEKFFAIYDVIKAQGLEKELLQSKQTFIEIPVNKIILTKKATLTNIAKRFDVDVQKLKQFNPAIQSANVAISKELKVRIPT